MFQMRLMNLGVGINLHGPEFQAHKPVTKITHPLLPKECRPRRYDFDESVDNDPNRDQEGNCQQNKRHVQDAFPLRDGREDSLSPILTVVFLAGAASPRPGDLNWIRYGHGKISNL